MHSQKRIAFKIRHTAGLIVFFQCPIPESPLPIKGRRICGDVVRIDGMQPAIRLEEVEG